MTAALPLAEMAATTLVVSPHAAVPAVTWVARGRGVIDRRPLLLDVADAGDAAPWVAAARVVMARQVDCGGHPGSARDDGGSAPDALALVSWAWPSRPEDRAQAAADRQLLQAISAQLGLAGVLVDAGGARALGEARFGVGAELGDQIHLGVGVHAAGVQLEGRWRLRPDGRPWSADGVVIEPSGAVHPSFGMEQGVATHEQPGRGQLRDWTWPSALTAAVATMGHLRAAPAPGDGASLDPAAHLRSWQHNLRVGCPLAREVIHGVGTAVGVAVGGLLNVLDVPDVVLHCAPEDLRAPLLPVAEAALRRHSFASLRAGLAWHTPKLGEDAVALGAALLARPLP